MSKEEAVNTFTGGMVRDYNPLNTPNNVLTNCLNGTVLTLDRNEFVLQNDDGNGEVHTAFLDAGYIPVGMQEYGGIIYVAAYNPLEGKGQIGSFPSPQQLYTSENLDNIAQVSVPLSVFVRPISGYDETSDNPTQLTTIPLIESEYYRQRLFENRTTGEARKFHPGDKFMIVSEPFDDEVKEAMRIGALVARLGVINSSGGIDYLDESSLRMYDYAWEQDQYNGLSWIYQNQEGTPVANLMRENDKLQIFSGRSSGYLIMVLELRTISVFNLIRRYTSSNNVINVEFTGQMSEGVFNGITTDPFSTDITKNVRLFSNNTVSETVNLNSNQGSQVAYNISPVSPYGVLQRLTKSGIIDFDSIRSNSENFSEWRYFISPSNNTLRIGWGYDYYNLNDDEDINRITFTFIPLEITPTDLTATTAASLNGYTYEMKKENFSGSFEEIIPISSSTVELGKIYVVRIDRYFTSSAGETKGDPIYRFLYTGTYFNTYYANTPDFQTLTKPMIDLTIKTVSEANVSEQGASYKYKTSASSSNFVSATNLSQSDFIRTYTDNTVDTSDLQFWTKKTREYLVSITPEAGFDFDNNIYAGTPSSAFLGDYFGNNPTIQDEVWDNSGINFNGSSYLNSVINEASVNSDSTSQWSVSNGVLTGRLSTARSIISDAGNFQSSSVQTEVLAPAYSAGTSVADRDRVFSWKEGTNYLTTAGGRRGNTYYGTTVTENSTTTGNTHFGTATGDSDDSGLWFALDKMGNGTVGIMSGVNGDYASYRINGASRRNNAIGSVINGSLSYWNYSKNPGELDSDDNFMVATWKNIYDQHYVINLASRKNESQTLSNSQNVIVRLDYMLRCILSQLCTAKTIVSTKYVVGPNLSNIAYHLEFDTHYSGYITPEGYTGSSEYYTVDTFLSANQTTSVQTLLDRWTSTVNIVDYMPSFRAQKTRVPFQLSFGRDLSPLNDASLLAFYTNAYANVISSIKIPLPNGVDRGKVYLGVVSSVSSNGTCTLQTDDNGSVQVKGTNIFNGYPGGWSLGALSMSLDDCFTTRAALEGITNDPLPEGYYNEILMTNQPTSVGTWTKGSDSGSGSNAPDMAKGVYIGNTRIVT